MYTGPLNAYNTMYFDRNIDLSQIVRMAKKVRAIICLMHWTKTSTLSCEHVIMDIYNFLISFYRKIYLCWLFDCTNSSRSTKQRRQGSALYRHFIHGTRERCFHQSDASDLGDARCKRQIFPFKCIWYPRARQLFWWSYRRIAS